MTLNAKLGLFGLVFCMGLPAIFPMLNAPVLANPAGPSSITDAELRAFGQQLFDIHARQAKNEYLDLIHPNCPAPFPQALDSTFSRKWLSQEAHAIRIKAVEEQFDMTQLTFQVQPSASIEIQTWTLGRGGKRELVTFFPVAKYQGKLTVIDYPCFQ